MTLTDLLDTAARLSLVLLTLSGLVATEMILAARMLRVPEKAIATGGIKSKESQLN